jgi:hypothetical protein
LVGLGLELRASLHICKSGIHLEPHLQSILLWLFWKWGPKHYCPGWPQTSILPILASQEARVTGVTHRCLTRQKLLMQGGSRFAEEGGTSWRIRMPQPGCCRWCCFV